jgi:large subunit ribosomal protein L15
LTALDIDKVLGSGRMQVALKIIVAEASAKAIEKIEAAGGSLEMEEAGEE